MTESSLFMGAFALGLFALIVGSFIAITANQTRQHRALLEAQAAKRGGQVKGRFPVAYPRLIFPYQGREVSLYLKMGSRSVPPHATVRAHLGWHSEAHLTLRREGIFQQLRKWLGVQDIDLGDPAFDNVFIVQGQRELAQQVLSPAVQQALLAMASWQPELEARGDYFSLTISRIPESEEEYDRLIETAMGLLERLGPRTR